ncbi:MAG: M48 family metallopeptidase [Methylococcaceae bacterium]|nr:M48 family metallopeptidase [Methylococcaceae bacterium]
MCSRAVSRRGLIVAGLMLGLLGAGSAGAYGLCPGEMENAGRMQQRILREWPLRSSSDPASRFIQQLGVFLAQYGDEGIPWRFSLVRNLAPNAFSIGAGNVFVTEGAITFAQSESELAAIIAHELGHELAGHFCADSYSRGEGDIFMPPSEHYEVGVGSIRQSIDPAKEQQADRIAVSLLQAAGYDPHAMLQVARRLPAGGEVHLHDPRRIHSLERLLAGYPPAGGLPDSLTFKEVRRVIMGETHQR